VSSVDDVIFYPEGTDFEKFTFNAFGLTSYTAPDGSITYKQYDAKGRPVYTKDEEGNILEKLSYTSWAASASAASPVSFEVPSPIYDGVPVNFIASLGCVDVESIQWKMEPTSSPGSGTYVVGTATKSLTFANVGTNNYVVYLKVSHPSYGSYEYSRQISVALRPLDVVMCTEGATRRDLCKSYAFATFATCTGQTHTSTSSTQFNLTMSGCSPGATYTYQWQIDDGSGFDDIQYTTTPTITMINAQSYTIRCFVTSSCGRSGLSDSQRVVVFQSTPGCPPYPEE
jgi:YD repeat-containing protein